MICDKMWIKAFFVNIFIFSSLGLHKNVIKFSIEYFTYREIKFVCLLTCDEDNYWSQSFFKIATQNLIAVSRINFNKNNTSYRDLQKCLYQKLTSVGVFIDSECSSFKQIMDFAASNTMFDSTHKWLVVENDDDDDTTDNTVAFYKYTKQDHNSSETIGVVDNLNTSVDSDIIIGSYTENFVIELYEAFNFGKLQGGNLSVEHVGTWKDGKGLAMIKNLNSYKYYNRWNFQEWAMRMIVVYSNLPENFDPEMLIGRKTVSGVADITHTAVILLHTIADIHNFRFVYTLADRWIGAYKPENTKVVASALYYGYQDISPVIRISSDNVGKIYVAHPPLTSIETRYYYRIPTYGPGKFENQFFRPLTTDSWLCVMAVVILCAMALLLAAKLEQRPMPAQYALFSVVASFCQQFFNDAGESYSRKISEARQIAVFVTGLSFVLIYNYYTSSVVSWLLNGPPPSINSLQELLESPLQLIYEDIGYSRSWLQSPDYYYNNKNAEVEDEMRRKKVFSKKPGDPLLLSAEEGIDMVKAGGYAFHTEAFTANKLISRKFNQRELCELGSLQSMEKTLLFPAIQKNSPYKEFLVWSLARLSERGVVSCIQHRTSVEPVSCAGSSPRALALGGAAPAFLLLVFGYLLATVIMLIERFVHRRRSTLKLKNIYRFDQRTKLQLQ